MTINDAALVFYWFQEIHDTDNLFRLMVASICPTIYGHSLVKAGLILCLFGGTAASPNAIVSRRSDINVLIVGDPGLGKSQMLSVVSEVAPRGTEFQIKCVSKHVISIYRLVAHF
jgi:DNA helicase MCM8